MASAPAETQTPAPAWALRWEQLFIVAACGLALVGIPTSLGHIGLSWDALNHQIYLGWTAEHPRFDRDYMAASYQSYQYPYLYWPLYKLAIGGASGAFAGVVLALIHLLAVPAIWRIAHTCTPGNSWFDLIMRGIGTALALTSGVVLSMFDSTSNDLVAAIPLVWAIALALPVTAAPGGGPQGSAAWRAVAWSGAFAGVSIAFKLSNGPVAIVLPLLWAWTGPGLASRARLLVWGGLFTILGFVVAYAPWGWQLWTHFGNPLHPFVDGWFEPLRLWTGWER